MFIVSYHEQNIQFNLHCSTNGKFEAYNYETDSDNKIKSATRKTPIHQVIIFGYLSKYNKDIMANYQIYHNEHFAVMEIDDKIWEHLITEHGTNTFFTNGIIFAEKNQTTAINKAKERLKNNGIKSIDTGARPLELNDRISNMFQLPQATKIDFRNTIY